VVDDIERLQREHGIDQLFFTDSIFNDPAGHYLTVAEEIQRRGVQLRWSAFFRPQGLGSPELALLKESGLYALELGTDAASDATLQGLAKGFTFAEVNVTTLEKFGSLVIVPKGVWSKVDPLTWTGNMSPVSSGPFMLEAGSFNEQSYKLVRNPYYWQNGKDGKPLRIRGIVIDLGLESRRGADIDALLSVIYRSGSFAGGNYSFLTVCSVCGKVKSKELHWIGLSPELFHLIGEKVSHGICPSCLTQLYPDMAEQVLGSLSADGA